MADIQHAPGGLRIPEGVGVVTGSANGAHRGLHARPGGCAVINEDDDAILGCLWRPVVSIRAFAARQLIAFDRHFSLERC